MTARQVPWRPALTRGLLWGLVAVFVSVVGLVGAFTGKPLIVGIISLGHTLLLLIGVGAGIHVARGAAGAARTLLRGTLAGAAAGVAMGAFLAAGSAVNLRAMFVNASPELFAFLTFGRVTAAIWVTVLLWTGLGLAGAAAALLPPVLRRPLGTALTTLLVVGLFQELFQLLLQREGLQTAVRGLLFLPDGLSLQGAVITFVGAAGLSVALGGRIGALRGWVGQRPPRQRRTVNLATFLLAGAVLAYLPVVAGPFLSQVLVLVGLYTLMGLGLNLEVGFAGLLDLGFVAFFAIGAYTVGLLTSVDVLGIARWSFWAAIPAAFLVSLLAGVFFGIPVLRIRGDYLAIATLGFGEIIRLLVLSDFLRPWLGGSQGVLSVPKPMLGTFEFAGPQQLYYITIVASALIAFVGARLRDSRLGRAWMAMREDEDVAEAMGINTVNIKLLAYGLGGAFAGVSGAIFAVMLGSVFPFSFSLLVSINVLSLIIVGGIGSQPGVIVGSLFLVGMPELLREFADFRFLVYGAALIIMMQARPEGLWPAAAQRRELRAEELVPSLAVEEAAAPAEGTVEA